MRAFLLLGCMFLLTWPVQGAASVIQPDIGANWQVPDPGSVAKKRGRAELIRKGRGADAKPVAHHSVKHYAQRPAGVDRLDAGKWGMEKGLIFSDSHRKGISLIGQIQLLPPPDGPYSAPSPWNFGVVRVIAAVVVGVLGLTTIGLLAAHKPVRYRRRKRGPYTRPAHSPHARRWLRESCPQPLC